MKRVFGWSLIVVGALVSIGSLSLPFTATQAEAQTVSTAPAVQTEVLVQATPTEMPRTKGRTAFEAANNGPASIYCAPSSAGAVVNKARPVGAGTAWGLDAKDSSRWWCIAAVAQVTGAGTIFTELR